MEHDRVPVPPNAGSRPTTPEPHPQDQQARTSTRPTAPQITIAEGSTQQAGSTGHASFVASPSSMERREEPETQSADQHRNSRRGLGVDYPLPPLPPAHVQGENGGIRRSRTADTLATMGRTRSGIDWIVPVDDKPRKRTVGERLQPTLDIAEIEKEKYAMKAKMTGYALNAAIGIQVLLGSLTTGLSAVATTGRQTAISTTILGGLATVVASYLARARGSNEPELSITRVKDLEHFIRECKAFQLDHGHVITNEFDERLIGMRDRFEELLGNANGERKLSTPV
ncbi:hypothetical protein BDQ12DRAFT_633635 [Crucibulum laeve]|uniref:SMODS and SLOG-associating 2TM effector domain-containing protein n=1 Tax=Crucibulum laeve TaxID=68775 RepID=A0A5C3LXW0_9AGAR|nr:hypothetical protein BDQ12DRAFT_633635 [Crucibulum laeve]